MLLIIGFSFAQEPPLGRPSQPRSKHLLRRRRGRGEERRSWGSACTIYAGLLDQIGGAKVAMDTMWTLIAGMLVFFMNLGFATVESGLCRAKNTVDDSGQELHRVRGVVDCVFGFGLGSDVR